MHLHIEHQKAVKQNHPSNGAIPKAVGLLDQRMLCGIF